MELPVRILLPLSLSMCLNKSKICFMKNNYMLHLYYYIYIMCGYINCSQSFCQLSSAMDGEGHWYSPTLLFAIVAWIRYVAVLSITLYTHGNTCIK